MKTIQAGTVVQLPARFYDFDGSAAIPTLISYKVYCLTTGTLVRDSTPISPPLAEIEIQLEETDTAMQGTDDLETRKVCVTSTYGAGDSRTDVYKFNVLRADTCDA